MVRTSSSSSTSRKTRSSCTTRRIFSPRSSPSSGGGSKLPERSGSPRQPARPIGTSGPVPGDGDARVDLKKFAQDYIARATERISAAEDALKRGSFPEVIRFSQEATELSLKAALRLVGIEYPKVHDVGDVLQLNAKRFPEKFQERIPQIAEFSREAAAKRSLAMYGVEASGKTPGQIFDDPGEAADALGRA